MNIKARYWFTNEEGENILNDFFGTENDAIAYAEKHAEALGEDILINKDDDIVCIAYGAE